MKNAIILVCLLFSAFAGYSQVGIGTKNPDTTSVLDLSSTTKGLLIPRMTTVQRNAIISPAMGLQILNLDNMCLDIYDGRQWIKNCGMKESDALQGASRSSISDSIWTKDGDKIFPADPSRIGIGTEMPDSSALIDINSTSKGFLMPRMTTAQRDLIVAPAVGLQIVNLDDFCLDVYDGSGWIKNCGFRISSHDTIPTAWIKRDDCPGGGRFSAVAFAVGGKGYVGTGTSSDFHPKSDFWEYNPFSKSWSQIADFEGGTREGAVAFSIGNKGYVGTGYSSTAKNDFWEYDPITNDWERLQDFLGSARWNAVGFSINSKGYIGTGTNGDVFNDFYEYDPIAHEWTIIEAFEGEARYQSVGFAIDGKGYVGTGRNSGGELFSDFQQYDPIINDWISVDSLPVATLSAKAFTISNKGYLFTAPTNESSNDLYKYDPELDQWTFVSNFPGIGRLEAIGFSIGNSGYLGTGSFGQPFSDFWEYRESSIEPVYTNSSEVSTAYSFHDGIWSRELENTFLTHDGNVGIGIDLPANKLDLSTETRSGIHAAGLPMYVTGALAESSNGIEFRHSNGTQGIGFGYNTIYATGSAINQDLGLKARGPIGGLKFLTNNTERVRILGNGNVGIGTNNPLQSLHVEGNAIVSSNLGIGTNNPIQSLHVEGNAIVSSNLGIGLNSPNNKLDINSGAGRTGYTHPGGRPLYVTGDILESSNGIEFRESNGTQGIGFGYNTIYATGSNYSQDLGLMASGLGNLKFTTGYAERMRIQSDGNVGIGNTNPHAPLQFKNVNASRKIVFFEATDDDNQFTGFGLDPAILRYNVSGTSLSHVFYAGTSPSTKAELMRITGTGNVGIGHSEPHAPLQFKNISANRKIVLWELANNDHQFSGFGIDSAILRYCVQANTINHVFYAGNGPSSSNELMRIQGNGNVSIGISNATNKLDINGNNRTPSGHPTGKPLYVTGNIGAKSNGIEFRHDNGTQGIGFGYNTIYATGSQTNQDLGLIARGPAGILKFTTDSMERMCILGNGNVGIGHLNPNAPLQFKNISANRKIVLWELANNDHQFSGFGIDSAILRYCVQGSDINHVFYAGTSPSTSAELLRITGTGNVGIGNSTPHAPLQFKNISANRKIVLWETTNNNHEFYGFGINAGILRYQVPPIANHVFYAGTSPSTSAELLRITGTGNVGIGNSTPNAPLQFANSVLNRKVVLYEDFNNDHQFYGLGIGGAILRYQVGGSGASHVFYAGSSPSTSAELMRITGTGNVGIGISNVTNKMDINGNNRTVESGHATGRPLYVTGNIGESSNGIEFRHDNGTQGIGFGWNTIYATGSLADQNLGLQARGSAGILKFTTGNIERMRIQGNGFVGIGITNPEYQLQLSTNSAAKPGTLFWTVASDSRLKKDIEPFTDGLDLIGKINPVWFRYNGLNGITDTARYAGIIAQEMQKVAPYMISTTKSEQRDGENYLSYDGNSMTYILINAVKEQQIQIQQQQDRIDILEKELKAESTADVADMKAMMVQMQQEIQQLKQERK